eukprot:GHVS01088601.1.p1 GENE.GHVS01088601.1~~GHVS01088601.1.p1  ORF type:complete len:410 (-),score=71.66 GHVS01088601.1:56-1285(-)
METLMANYDAQERRKQTALEGQLTREKQRSEDASAAAQETNENELEGAREAEAQRQKETDLEPVQPGKKMTAEEKRANYEKTIMEMDLSPEKKLEALDAYDKDRQPLLRIFDERKTPPQAMAREGQISRSESSPDEEERANYEEERANYENYLVNRGVSIYAMAREGQISRSEEERAQYYNELVNSGVNIYGSREGEEFYESSPDEPAQGTNENGKEPHDQPPEMSTTYEQMETLMANYDAQERRKTTILGMDWSAEGSREGEEFYESSPDEPVQPGKKMTPEDSLEDEEFYEAQETNENNESHPEKRYKKALKVVQLIQQYLEHSTNKSEFSALIDSYKITLGALNYSDDECTDLGRINNLSDKGMNLLRPVMVNEQKVVVKSKPKGSTISVSVPFGCCREGSSPVVM